jgi:hypothetical protein
VSDFTLQNLCVHLPSLAELRLSGCSGVTDGGLFFLSQGCDALRVRTSTTRIGLLRRRDGRSNRFDR